MGGRGSIRSRERPGGPGSSTTTRRRVACYLAGWRRSTGKSPVDYAESVEEALCVGWIDSKGNRLDDERNILWFAPRNPRSGWARSNKDRVARLTAAGLMLPAGLAAIEEAKRRGTWTMLDEVEDLVVPDDLASALEANPPARTCWDGFSRSSRRMLLEWIRQAKRPETRAKRITETADARRTEREGEPVGPAGPARVGRSGIRPQPRVGDEIVVRPGPELGAALDALAHEPGLLERMLLGHVLDIGRRLHAIGIGRREQLRREQALRLRSEALAAARGDQRDPDVPGTRLVSWSVPHLVPATVPIGSPVSMRSTIERPVALVAQRPLGQRLTQRAHLVRPAEVVEVAAHLGRLPGLEVREVGEGGVAQPDARRS